VTDAPFLAAIRAAPEDDAPRLVYADWLDEHGQSERAEFIRVQVELARRESADLRAREAELLARHHDDFAGRLLAPGFRFRFGRGFITGFGHTGVFVTYPDQALSSEDRYSSRPLFQFLRFFPNNVVITTTSTGTPKEVCRWFRPGNVSAAPSIYRFVHFDYHATVNFSYGEGNDQIEFSGQLTFDLLEVETRSSKCRMCVRQQYSHARVKGTDSYSDVPPDAAPPA
jgi:uncharacterized protein (TIGR02996 family)